MGECVLILASAPLIFTAAVDGTLAQNYAQDANLQAEYALVQERAYIQPSIYIHLLADGNGITPSANQLLTVADIVTMYIDTSTSYANDALCALIDNISPPPFPTLQPHRPVENT
jgi:hypothetical protein